MTTRPQLKLALTTARRRAQHIPAEAVTVNRISREIEAIDLARTSVPPALKPVPARTIVSQWW